ncbi:gamma-glutamyl-gamma-aminobutyrate hydrolase family protein [Nocardioides campestrisoli]|uniref:gamma-glutamyl-gamma-aminobutyrate hydrolase family protein n=1 Tax=Nocardioides campestrisoli TaxID=2736757 RepID=UPI0015E75E5C|nr:gamma-glutamyl-gamma-aminobutyrate hydrolase family protein [Nocardioides campestrisoli]
MSRPHVLVVHQRTSRPHAPDFQAKLDVLNSSALDVVAGLGLTAELWAAAEHPHAATVDAVDRADVVVVMGGEDVHPSWYAGAPAYPEQGHHDLEGDAGQLAVIERCLERGTPLLGLCRGHQLLNVALGGTLVQHLPTVDRHRTAGDDPFVAHHVQVDASLAADVDASRAVYCTHHQAVDTLGGGLVVAAHSTDGVVEAVVGAGRPVTGIQWHPEHPADAAVQLRALVLRLVRQAGGDVPQVRRILTWGGRPVGAPSVA